MKVSTALLNLPISEVPETSKADQAGVKGMQWGVTRSRSQIDSGSSSTSTVKKTTSDTSSSTSSTKKGDTPETTKSVATATPKMSRETAAYVSKTMSDADLRSAINRMNMEKQYVDLVSPKPTASTKSLGRQMLEKVAKEQAEALLKQYTAKGVVYATKKISAKTGVKL